MSTGGEAIALSVSGLNKNYGDFPVIRGLDLSIATGAIHGLVGLNGSGKTTTLECMLGLQSFNSGKISLLDFPPSDLHRARGRIVGIFDTPSLNPNLTIRQCLHHAALLCDNTVRSPAEVEALLGIERFSGFKIKHLSLGNKRRASIAQALLGEPELVVLDEPFNGLDAGGVDDVLGLISRLNKEHGTTFLLSSHQLPYLERVCSHIAILHHGSIVASDAIGSLLAQTNNMVLLKSPAASAARALVDQLEGARFSHQDEAGLLHIAIDGLDSAQLNQQLVAGQVPVSELILQRASLDSLFRKLTSGPLS